MARRENGAGTEPKQDDNGRWWMKVSYRDVDNGELKRTTIRGATQKEVLDKKKKLLKTVDAGVKPKASKITLGDWMDTWLEVYKKNSVANGSYVNYKIIINNHIKRAAIGEKAIDKIQRVDLQKFLNDKKDSLSPYRLNQIKRVIFDALNIAEMDKLILHNTCKKIKLPKIEKKEISPLSPDEIKLVLESVGRGNLMYNVIFLAIHTGMRLGEICGLRWCDIDFKKKQITVKQQAKPEKIEGQMPQLVLGKLKTESSYRTIPMDNRLVETLKWHQAQQNKQREINSINDNDLGLVFCEPTGKIMNPSTTSYRFRNIMISLDIPYRNFHQLRHTFASVAISQGQNIKAISAILGHSDTSTTLNVYGHLLPGDTESVIESVASFYGL